MVDWQVTATTILCDVVDDEVTIMVYKDGSVKCVGYQRYGAPGKGAAQPMKQKGRQRGRKLECEGPECHRALQYRDKLFAEATGKTN